MPSRRLCRTQPQRCKRGGGGKQREEKHDGADDASSSPRPVEKAITNRNNPRRKQSAKHAAPPGEAEAARCGECDCTVEARMNHTHVYQDELCR